MLIDATVYRYKWVSNRLGGQPDLAALLKAYDRGWEPVPYGQAPVDIALPCVEEKLGDFVLHRMPEQQAQKIEGDRAFLNSALQDIKVMAAVATLNIKGQIADMRAEGITVGEHWDPDNALLTNVKTLDETALFAKKVAVAHKWLRDRKLA